MELKPFNGYGVPARFPGSFIAFDLETTGLNPKTDRIIEIAAVRVTDGAEDGCFSRLINPGTALPSRIVELTGITDEMLAGAPAIEDVLPEFLAYVGTSVVAAHNARFDLGFINAACYRLGLGSFGSDYIDTLSLDRAMFPQYKHHRLSDLVERLGLIEDGAHRALADARNVALALAKYNDICTLGG